MSQNEVDVLKDEIDALRRDYDLLSATMIYRGNSVQHWCDKACAYGDVVMRVFNALRRIDLPYSTLSVEPMLRDLIAAYASATTRIIELESALDTYEHAADYKSAEQGCS